MTGGLDALSLAAERFTLGGELGRGAYGQVFRARDTQQNGYQVAIKVQRLDAHSRPIVENEYRLLKNSPSHPNLVDFLGAYRQPTNFGQEIWFVMEICEHGPIIDLVKGLLSYERRMYEDHIAYTLKEVIKGLLFLHEKVGCMHRDIRGSNILLTRDGGVKLTDMGMAKHLETPASKSKTRIGSPYWMAPEVVLAEKNSDEGYDNRVDVWGLGIFAIELGEGQAPLEGMHPTRALFQIAHNPPPTLKRRLDWSENYNDFIIECLEKKAEHRPYLIELTEHPFILKLPENDYYLSQELKSLVEEGFSEEGRKISEASGQCEQAVHSSRLHGILLDERLLVEDLVALDGKADDPDITRELMDRLTNGRTATFVGDILLQINKEQSEEIYNEEWHSRYVGKSRSDNIPHLFSVADSAYHDMTHHQESQLVVVGGESGSGKTFAVQKIFEHLLYLGKSENSSCDQVTAAWSILEPFYTAATPLSALSTRCCLIIELTFSISGKLSGAIFDLNLLEKTRIFQASEHKDQSNFKIFPLLISGLDSEGRLEEFGLSSDYTYKWIQTKLNPNHLNGYKAMCEHLKILKFEDECINTIWRSLAAILLLGEIEFEEVEDQARIKNESIIEKVAELWKIDQKRLSWALCHFCFVDGFTAERRFRGVKEAELSRDFLAALAYSRLLDSIVNQINYRLAHNRNIFGDSQSIKLIDYGGFECFNSNGFNQLLINIFNEQMQFYFNQKVFVWEMQELNEEGLQSKRLSFPDNRSCLEALMGKPQGILSIIDQATRFDNKIEVPSTSNFIREKNADKITVAHYTGRVTYDTREMANINRQFLPPELIEVFRASTDGFVRHLFAGKLSRSGALTSRPEESSKNICENMTHKRYNTPSKGQYSQSKGQRTAVSVFRAACLDLLRDLGSNMGVHYVRCLRGKPPGKQELNQELILWQVKALAVKETMQARKLGFASRIPFPEFIRRYKFLAFDFDESVEVTRENCRLLLIRLKIEGWQIGKSKVFLKYYNEEYLTKIYAEQLRKIIRVQAMFRSFLARIHMKKKKNISGNIENMIKRKESFTEDMAATLIQKGIRGYQTRKRYGPLLKEGPWNSTKKEFMRYFCKKWRNRSLFQILLMYRSIRYQDLVSLAQQVHLFSQNVVSALQVSCRESVVLDHVDPKPGFDWLEQGLNTRPPIWRRPFNLLDVPFRDTSPLCPTLPILGVLSEEIDDWDIPIRRGRTAYQLIGKDPAISLPFSREIEDLQYLNETSVNSEDSEQLTVEIKPEKEAVISPKAKQKKYAVYKGAPKGKTEENNCEFAAIKLRPARPNPIEELEKRGIRSDVNADEAPFNFQAMLRKTNTKRGSLKRGKNHSQSLDLEEVKLNEKNLIFESPVRREPKFIIEKQEKFQDTRVCKDPDEFDENAFIPNLPEEDPIYVDLVPGLLRVQGSVEDL